MKHDKAVAQHLKGIRLTHLERKVQKVMFKGIELQPTTLAECARQVGASQGWCHHAFLNLIKKTMPLYWGKPEKPKTKG